MKHLGLLLLAGLLVASCADGIGTTCFQNDECGGDLVCCHLGSAFTQGDCQTVEVCDELQGVGGTDGGGGQGGAAGQGGAGGAGGGAGGGGVGGTAGAGGGSGGTAGGGGSGGGSGAGGSGGGG